ncbi:flagellar motor protein MotA [Vibrio sp. vnigr-6D03]|uniref:motility protein A n=1 Tax=Vibrio sp. vnigr-6D03 TaxID=2058088 RepID=UPI000C33B6C7|nr:MotA/TolQ/ExbB proton channel family protein [Vibrio sp. vnigr-6D03]PKF78435.1 flagellar motor protein MotA [Vibrio sp. vnigr-6D03]
MSLSTITGWLFSVAVLMTAVVSSTDNYWLFVSVSSLLIVAGGTSTAALISYSYPLFFKAIQAVIASLFDGRNETKLKHSSIVRSLEWNKVYRIEGIAGLEKALTNKELKDPFIAMAIELLGTGYKGKALRNLLDESNESQRVQEAQPANVLSTMANFSPAFGMIGTLVGLIVMLDSLDGDMATMGKGLAIALLTTLYGTLLAQALFKPSAINVRRKSDDNFHRRDMQIQAFVMMTEKQPDLHIKDSMNSYLPPKKRLES